MNFKNLNWRRMAQVGGVFGTLMGFTLAFWFWTYNDIRISARNDELAFWDQEARQLTPLDRSALLNYIDATGEMPEILPWWELDEDRCSATVTKYINLFTGIELVHAPAWKVRNLRGTVNARKLISRWDGAQKYNDDGTITKTNRTELVNEVAHLDYDPNKVYMIGLLWSHTRWWNVIQQDGEDINSHVALYVHGHVIHFIHTGDDTDPLKVETLDGLFASGDLSPVWVSEVAQKSRVTSTSHGKLVEQPFELPATTCTLSFQQAKAPWWLIDMATYIGWHDASLDTFMEKSALQRLAQWGSYDMYPNISKELTCAE